MSDSEHDMKCWVESLRQQVQLARKRRESDMLIRMTSDSTQPQPQSHEDPWNPSYLSDTGELPSQEDWQIRQPPIEDDDLFDEEEINEPEASPGESTSISYPPGDLRHGISSGNEGSPIDDLLARLELEIGHEVIRKQGYLEASSDIHRRWKRFWAVLRNSTLILYKDEREYRAKRIIYVTQCKKILVMTTKRRTYVVKLETSTCNYFLAIESAEELSNWLEVLGSVMGTY